MRINIFYVIFAVVCFSAIAANWLVRPSSEKTVSTFVASKPTPPSDQVLTAATSPLPAPTGLSGHVVGQKVFLSWDLSTDPEVRRYRVVRNDLLIAEVTFPQFADIFVVAGRQFGYYVQAIDGQGRFSQPSNFIIVTVTTSLAVAPTSATHQPTADVLKNINTTNKKNTPAGPTQTTPVNATPTTTEEMDMDDDEQAPAPTVNTTPTAPANTNTPSTNTAVSSPQNYTVSVTEDGEFTPLTISLHVNDTVTFTYVSGEGDEVILQFTPSIGSTVKLDHEHTVKTVTLTTARTYTYRRQDGSASTGTIIVTAS